MFKFSIVKNDYIVTDVSVEQLLSTLTSKGHVLDEKEPNFVFVIGGDGTFLKAVQKYQNSIQKIKFIPFKSGGIGFYTNKNRVNELETILEMIDKETYFEHSYEMLEIKNGKTTHLVTNEMKILNETKATYIKIFINDEYLETFHGTGLVVSTQTGSTGYMKSTGGAVILAKGVGLYQIQELVPVSTNKFRTLNSPIILDKRSKVRFELENINDLLICDTKQRKIEDKILDITVSDIQIKMISHINPKDTSEIKVLRDIFIKDKEMIE
ncbi:inorganic polyphosphate/ATP-NAD kinase [Spiroplasma chinense]|uniref:Inorganic polyphosphate/ATP-NAD kinase n=1 Tax=Spiroplasma chinense TaxID=216932 RepID=A0A5B9Y3E6_9MOLU|nr:NAD(+)/NADH kinase [Spiroplasma chinense]QEH61564.1 inorganic polyphosphate/ATP-NAD kinase [Spiroplasma chinense]